MRVQVKAFQWLGNQRVGRTYSPPLFLGVKDVFSAFFVL